MPSLRAAASLSRQAPVPEGSGRRRRRRDPCGASAADGRGTAGSARAARRRAALRHGPLVDRKDRLAGVAVEHEHQALLGRLDHRVARRRRVSMRRQRRLGRDVVVPDVVMHGLEGPGELAGRGLQRDDRVGVPLAPGRCRRRSRGWAGGRQEDQPAPPRRPTSAPRRWRRRPAMPRRHRADRTSSRRAGPRVVGAHRRRAVRDPLVVVDGRADDDHAARDDRRRGDLQLAGPLSFMPMSSCTSPLPPKSAQGAPVLASSAITRTSFVPMKMRARRPRPGRPASSRQNATPRQLNCLRARPVDLGSKRQSCAPVPGSSAITSLNGVQRIRRFSTKAGSPETWCAHQRCPRLSRSPVRNSQPQQPADVGGRDLRGSGIARAAAIPAPMLPRPCRRN